MKDSIRHYLQILAAGAALAMGASACGGDDGAGSGDDGGTAAATGTQFLQLAPYGSTRAAMNSDDTQFELAITVERQGKNASGQHKAALEPWGEAELRSFNAEEGSSYQLLPEDLYAIEPQEVTLEEGEAGKAAVLKLDPSAVFEQVKKTGAQYALGVTLSSESAKIVSSRRSLGVVLDLNYPRLEFDMPQVTPSVSLRQEETPVEIPTLFYYKVQGQEAGSPIGSFTIWLLSLKDSSMVQMKGITARTVIRTTRIPNMIPEMRLRFMMHPPFPCSWRSSDRRTRRTWISRG